MLYLYNNNNSAAKAFLVDADEKPDNKHFQPIEIIDEPLVSWSKLKVKYYVSTNKDPEFTKTDNCFVGPSGPPTKAKSNSHNTYAVYYAEGDYKKAKKYLEWYLETREKFEKLESEIKKKMNRGEWEQVARLAHLRSKMEQGPPQ